MYMMLVYGLPFVTIGLFHKIGTLADADRMGGRTGLTWAAVSALGWVATFFVLRWPIFYGLGLQFGLLVAIFVLSTVWGVVRENPVRRRSSDKTCGRRPSG
jgi:hypothetical protein